MRKLFRCSQSARDIQALIRANKNYRVLAFLAKQRVNTCIRLWMKVDEYLGEMRRLP